MGTTVTREDILRCVAKPGDKTILEATRERNQTAEGKADLARMVEKLKRQLTDGRELTGDDAWTLDDLESLGMEIFASYGIPLFDQFDLDSAYFDSLVAKAIRRRRRSQQQPSKQEETSQGGEAVEVVGATAFDAAMWFEDGDEGAARKLVRRWHDTKRPKPENLGIDPHDSRRNLWECGEILDYVEKCSGGLMPNERKHLREYLARKLRHPK